MVSNVGKCPESRIKDHMPFSLSVGRPFRLTRWFALLSMGSLALAAIVSATLLSRFVAERMLHRTGEVTMEFVHSLIRIHDGARFFEEENAASRDAPTQRDIEQVFGQVARMPDVIHANLYDRQRRVIWSTNREAIGRQLEFNPELAEALDGALVVESDILDTANYVKPEHVFLPGSQRHAVENYIPVARGDGTVVGVVELYMSPQSLIDDVRSLTRVIWLAAIGAAVLLFLVLLGIVRRADALIRTQQKQLVDAESLAAVGEMASAVAHGIRNPLASIRSSAELMVEDREFAHEFAPDIVRQVDRLEGWVRRLLSYAYQKDSALAAVDPNELVRCVADAAEGALRGRRVALSLSLDDGVPQLLADRDALEHALANLVTNAIEAMPEGGRLELATSLGADRRSVEIAVCDTGVGIAPDRIGKIFTPFQTSKTSGLGVGLPMVKRCVERLGGSIAVNSTPGSGTAFRVTLPVVAS
jgi:signal transduction histidine kinase